MPPLRKQTQPVYGNRAMMAFRGLCSIGLVLFCAAAGFSSPQEAKQDWETLRRSSSSKEVPWLVSVAGVCQGVLLNRWWVLSTASCLKNINPGFLPVRGEGKQLNASWICLHPNFVPSAGAIAAQSDLGMVLLPQPATLAGGQIHLAHDTRKPSTSCPFCGHGPCQVYQHQNPQEPGLKPAKKMAVKLLGSWACHHLGAHPIKTEGLCIWSGPWPGPDCWVQPGSPVLCRFGSRWELVGLVSKPSKVCYVPILAVRTAPYLSWMDAVIKATQKKPLSLPCKPSPRSSPDGSSWAPSSISSLSPKVVPRLRSFPDKGSSTHSSPQVQPALLDAVPMPAGRRKSKQALVAPTRLPPNKPAKPVVLPLGIQPALGAITNHTKAESPAAQVSSAKTGPPGQKAEKAGQAPDSAPSKARSEHLSEAKPQAAVEKVHAPARLVPGRAPAPAQVATEAPLSPTHWSSQKGQAQTRLVENPVRPQVHPKVNILGPSIVPKTAVATAQTLPVAGTVDLWPLSKMPPHGAAAPRRSPSIWKADAASPQARLAAGSPARATTDIIGPWVLPKMNEAGVQSPQAAVRKSGVVETDPAVSWLVPKSEAASSPTQPASDAAGPWILLKTEAAGPSTQQAPGSSEPHIRPEAHPALPVADAAGIWVLPTPPTDAIIPWAGPMTETASEAIIPWAGPAPSRPRAPSLVQGSDVSFLPGTPSSAHLLPSPAPFFAGSLPYPGPSLSQRFFPSSQSLFPEAVQTQSPLFSGAMQALAWGPADPSMPQSQKSGFFSGPDPSSAKDWLPRSRSSSSSSSSSFSPSLNFAPSPPPSPHSSPLPSSIPSSVGPLQFSISMPNTPQVSQQNEEQTLRVTLAQCHLGLGWRSDFQAYWLFQTALSSQQGKAECGMRPGFVSRCPNCWEAEEGEFPWVVSLQLSSSHFCSGSILNEWWVLTTASCANIIRNSVTLARVQAGVINLEDQVRAQLVGIHRALPHFGMQGPMGLGLILLQEPLRFHPRALAVCIEESPEKQIPTPQLHLYDCWVPGWTLIKGNLVTMQKQRLNVIEVSNCARYWPIKESMAFCVEAKKVMGQSSCKGDLGAPLMCRPKPHPEETPWVQMGILTAFDETCARPYVFSRIRPFVFWIKSSTKPQHPPWARPAPKPTLSSLPKPEALVNRISLRFAMPWQALIVTCDSQICSGSILSPSWILTSAHCIRDMKSENMAVFLGLPQPGGNMTATRVSSVVLHERYQSTNGVPWNDLALILLQKPLGPSQPLAPLGRVDDVNKAECWLTGPRELQKGESDQYPQALQVQVKDALSCSRLFPGIKSTVLCLGPRLPEFQMALDLMGPGSALLCRSGGANGTWRQTGLTSIKSLAFLLGPYFPWISKTSSVQTSHLSLNQSVGESAVAGPSGPLTFLPLLTLWLGSLTA